MRQMTEYSQKSWLLANPNLGIEYDKSKLREIWLAGGCFWGVEAYLARIYGVAETCVGYANGITENPSYEEIPYTGHAETVQVCYDPEKVSLEELLTAFFQIIDPTSVNKQGNDEGTQYRTGIYYRDPEDLPVIEKVVTKEQVKHDKMLATEVLPLENFSPAEEYHQKYLEKNPDGYCHIDLSPLLKTD